MPPPGPFEHRVESLGPAPLLHHFVKRTHIPEILRRYLADPVALRAVFLLHNILVTREPLYALGAWGARYPPSALGRSDDRPLRFTDDQLGRTLDQLFDLDRASLLTEIVVRVIHEFHLDLRELHNDSTTVTFGGTYREADGRSQRGQPTVAITFGKNKDHRPDLKQLLWSLTATVDGMVPIHYRVYDGSTNDAPTHWDTWTTLRSLVGRSDFLYVADSKLCAEGILQMIDSEGGRFLTVLPRTRKEDRLFRDWVQVHPVEWIEVERRETAWGESDAWRMAESPIPAADGFRLVWIWSTGMARVERESREEAIGRALQRVKELDGRLQNPRSRYRLTEKVRAAGEKAIGPRAARWVELLLREETVTSYRQAGPGRPGAGTMYRPVERKRFRVEGRVLPDRLVWEGKQDGMFPLLTNCRELTLAQLLEAYRWQPTLEKRHEQLKTVYSVAPVLLKKVTRIEGLLFVYFLAMLTEALLEREVRRGMAARGLEAIPLYPEARPCEAPTANRVLEAFAGVSRYRLEQGGREVQVFEPELTPIQRQLLELVGLPEEIYQKGG